jgi:predicted phosphodiesterase
MNSKGLQYVVGVISDTHGLLRSEAIDALRGSDLILHAGDIGSPEIIPASQSFPRQTSQRSLGSTDFGSLVWPTFGS